MIDRWIVMLALELIRLLHERTQITSQLNSRYKGYAPCEKALLVGSVHPCLDLTVEIESRYSRFLIN